MTTQNAAPTEAPRYRLTLVSFPPDCKTVVTSAVQKAIGADMIDLDDARRIIVENVPAVIDDYDSAGAARQARKVLEEAGALVKTERLTGTDALEASLRASGNAEAATAAPEALDAICDDLQNELCALVAIEMAMDSSYAPFPGGASPSAELQTSLRRARERISAIHDRLDRASAPVSSTDPEPAAGGEARAALELPEELREHLQEQQTRVAELLSLLERLDQDADQMYTRIAVREAQELERALDHATLEQVLKGQEVLS